MNKPLRAPAVPLATVDPYFSLWSFGDRLTDGPTYHWTGMEAPMAGILEIDGVSYRWMGKLNVKSDRSHTEPPAMEQISCVIRPLSTEYVFEAAGVRLEVTFMTPLLARELMIASRPVSYISYSLSSADGAAHSVDFRFFISAACSVDDPRDEVTVGRTPFSVCAGRGDTGVLARYGDDIRIDWGTLHLIHTDHRAVLSPCSEFDRRGVAGFLCTAPRDRKLLAEDARVPAQDALLFMSKSYEVSAAPQSDTFALAYDDIHSIEYFKVPIDAYYKKDGDTFEDAVRKAMDEYPAIREKVRAFEDEIIGEAQKIGDKYCDIVSLAYRQVFAAHKLCWDGEKALFFSKECFSNGCIATVDVTYPSIPMFIKYNPDLVKGMLEPIFRFADTPAWRFDFAPHDLGTYPVANCQVYGLDKKLHSLDEGMQMPVEECGNMILCAAAVCRAEKSADYALGHRELLEKWVEYLIDKGLDPANQLCTDDFAGKSAHNANLSAKAIVAVGAWGMILEMAGEDPDKYYGIAKELAAKWKTMARSGDHYRLAFDVPDSWSIKYNLVWDRLFGLGLFDADIFTDEVAYYKTQINSCGLPLDCRSDYTKSDWQMWSTALTDDASYRDMIVDAMWNMLDTTPDRVPFTDWYYTETGNHAGGGQNRTVQGGLFMPMMRF